MRILAIAPETTIFPVGISYVTAALKAAGHLVEGMTFTTEAALRGRGLRHFDLVMAGGLSAHYRQLEAIASVVNEAGVRFVMGGGIVTSEPELMTSATRADSAPVGEWEGTAVELVRDGEGGADASGVPGLLVRRGAAGVPWGRETEGWEHGDRVASGGSGATIPGALCARRRRP